MVFMVGCFCVKSIRVVIYVRVMWVLGIELFVVCII